MTAYPYRTVFKESWILMAFWSSSKLWTEVGSYVIMCHGCPSHPFDHTPSNNRKLLDAWYVLVYPNYAGTWGSDGICTFDNAVDSVLSVIDFLRKGRAEDSRSGKSHEWSTKEIILIGASFWGSVALCAGARSPFVDKIVSCSPVIDWRNHWLEADESALVDTVRFIKGAYWNLWRCDTRTLERFAKGDLSMNPVTYSEELKMKDVCIIHDRRDPQIRWKKVGDFFASIQNGSSKKTFYSQNKGRHILLHHLDEAGLAWTIRLFLADTLK